MTIALITGGSRGLGKNMAEHLADRGVDVILTYRSNEEAAQAVVASLEAKGRRAAALRFDANETSELPTFVESVQQTLTAWGASKLNYLVNNAGMGVYASVADTTEAQFDSLVNVHLKSVFFLTQRLMPTLADGGSVLLVSSGLARFSMTGYAAYGAMKGAIDTLVRYLAIELGERGIRVNSVAPGAIETDFGGGVVRDNKDLNAFIASQTALGRVGRPDDIGAAVAVLLSDDMGWVNGQRIELSGGIHL
ncbi:MAG: SDR family oxidoreductase [Myxococcota bacterium]